MIETQLYDYERDGLLIPARFWIKHLSAAQTKAIRKALANAFRSWKKSITDKNGMVKVSHSRNALAPVRERLVPGRSVTPFQCAGPDVANAIDLAFKLWLDESPYFKDVLEIHGTVITFSVLGIDVSKSADSRSLLRLNRFLVDCLAEAVSFGRDFFIDAQAHQENIAGLKKGQIISAANRTKERLLQDPQLRQMAVEYATAKPSAKMSEIAAHIAEHFDLNPSTILTRIRGTKAEALKSLERKK